MNLNAVIEENERRKASANEPYNPLDGTGALHVRRPLFLSDAPIVRQWLPEQMFALPVVRAFAGAGSLAAYVRTLHGRAATTSELVETWRSLVRLRILYDFEFWAAMFVKIKPKRGGETIPFKLNRPQRKLLALMETQRTAGKPIRIILLKARQWGGSTLVQIYMAWIQLVHKRNWHSTICAHLKGSSQNIRGMYSRLIEGYPDWLGEEGKPLHFRPYEHGQDASYISGRGCKVVVGTAESPNSLRGEDAAMAHCSEVAFWQKTDNRTPEDIVRSVCGGIALLPFTVIVYESTANGTGNYFYDEWMRAVEGKSDKTPLFVAWYEIEMYARKVDDYKALAASLSDYERWLWDRGATLENIAWYREKRKEYKEHAAMKAEYPSDSIEAFSHSGENVFAPSAVAELERFCCDAAYKGDVQGNTLKGEDALANLRFVSDPEGHLQIWAFPGKEPVADRYVAVVDVGGRSGKSDYSVIAVFDRYWQMYGGYPEVCAQWRGHIDHDLLAWKAVQIARYYGNALLVIESNTYETEHTGGDHTEYILDQIAGHYGNLYSRTPADLIREGHPRRWGFHTNISTKTLVVDSMVETVRETAYVERDREACHELYVFEKKKNGSYGAKDGHHDDIAMTRFIGLYICKTQPLPRPTGKYRSASPVRPISEATI